VESSALKPSVGMIVDGLTEEGVREGWSKGLKGGLAGSVVVKIL
jgi:NADPH2:quinone reductase